MTFYYHHPAYYQPLAAFAAAVPRIAYPTSTTYIAPRYAHPVMAIPTYGPTSWIPASGYRVLPTVYVPALTYLP